jgi:hypothetical protein
MDEDGNIYVSTKQEMNLTLYINSTTKYGTPYFYPVTFVV